MNRVLTGAEVRALLSQDHTQHQGSVKPKARGRHRVDTTKMNKTERAYFEFLQSRLQRGEITWFKYKPFSIKMADDLHYQPDFCLLDAHTSELIVDDVKGRKRDKVVTKKANPNGDRFIPWIEEDALVKIKAVATMFPFRFRVVWPLPGSFNAWGIREFSGIAEPATQEIKGQ